MIYLWTLSYQLQQNFGAFLNICKIYVDDYFIGFSNGFCKQDSENFTKLQRDQIRFWQIYYMLVEKSNKKNACLVMKFAIILLKILILKIY